MPDLEEKLHAVVLHLKQHITPHLNQATWSGICLMLLLFPQLGSAQSKVTIARSFQSTDDLATIMALPEQFQESPSEIKGPGTYWVKITSWLAPGRHVLYLGHIPEGELFVEKEGSFGQPESFGVLRVRHDQPIEVAQAGDWISGGTYEPNWGYSWQHRLEVDSAQEVSVYLRLDHRYHFAYPLPLEIMSWEEWVRGKGMPNPAKDVREGIFQGVLWGMVIYHFLLFLFYRDRSFLHYTLYLMAISLTFWDYFPMGREMLFGQHPYLGKVLLESADSMAGMLFFWFTRSFIRMKSINARWDQIAAWVLGGGVVLWVIVYGGYAWSLNFYFKASTAFLALPGLGFSIWFAVRLSKIKDTSVRYALVGGLVLILSTLVNATLLNSGRLGFVEISGTDRMAITEIFVLIQAFVFATGLGYRMRHTEQEKQQLAELDQVKSGFFANVSHEFRTPLTLILGPAKDLYQTSTSPEVRAQMSLILRNAHRLLHMVNQILDLAKLEGGKLRLKLVPQDLGRFMALLVSAFESAAVQKKIKLELDLPKDQVSAAVDPEKLEQIMTNLLSNAIRHTATGGKVLVRLRLGKRKRRLIIRVSDTGEGIAEEHLPHIFDRFYQARTDNFTTDQPSSGIGLALTKELVELHSGSISVRSTVGVGTSFQFWLPISFLPEGERTEAAISAGSSEQEFFLPVFPTAPSFPQQRSSQEELPHILLVEDNDDVRSYLRQSLQGTYQLREAVDGQMGLDMAVEHLPDLIITDVMMPKKDGFMLTRELKATESTDHIPIIILTGKSSPASKLEGLQTDADEYLNKPFDAQELEARIQNLLRNRNRLQVRFSQQILWGKGAENNPPSLEETFLQKAVTIIEKQLAQESFGVEQLAEALHLSRTQLFRKLKALTDLSPSRFIRSVRLRHAKALLESQSSTIAEIAYSVGFSSPTYFNRVFKEEFGTTPSEWMESGLGK